MNPSHDIVSNPVIDVRSMKAGFTNVNIEMYSVSIQTILDTCSHITP